MATAHNPTQAEALLVKPADACRMLGCSDTYLRKLTADGRIDVVYQGSHRRIVVESLRRYVAGLPQDPAA
jgi:excisionase family DNA binding protein